MHILFFIVLVDSIGFGIVLPLLPIFAIKFNLNAFELGLLAAGFAFAQLLVAPVLGVLSDKFGRKKIIVTCLLGLSASYFLLSIAHTFIIALIARVIAGGFTGNISVVYAMVSDLSSVAKREKYIGYIGAATGLGFVLGPIIGGFLAGNNNLVVDFGLIFGFASMFTLMAFFVALVGLKETSFTNAVSFNFITRTKRTIALISYNKQAMYLIYLSILMWFGFSAVYVYLASWTTHKFNLGARDLSIVSTLFGLCVAVTQIFSYKIATAGKAILIGFNLSAIAMLLVLFKPQAPLMITIVIMLAVGLGFLITNVNSGLSFLGLKSQKGFIFGLSQSASNTGQALGPLVVGLVYFHASSSYAWVLISIVFFMGSLLATMYTVENKKLPKITN